MKYNNFMNKNKKIKNQNTIKFSQFLFIYKGNFLK